MIHAGIWQFFDTFIYIYRIVRKKDYRDYAWLLCKYGGISRYKKSLVNVWSYAFLVPDVASFLSTWKAMFIEKAYLFKPNHQNVKIIDFGANIGLSLLFFAKHYPMATIEAYEADPFIYKFLVYNVKQFQTEVKNIVLHNAAVWVENKVLRFYSEGADGGRIRTDKVDDMGKGKVVDVQAIDVNEILQTQPYIDLLKIDIEGAENDIIERIKPHLFKVDNIFIEYHSDVKKEQKLHVILTILHEAGFRVFLQTIGEGTSFFVQVPESAGFDMQTNIWGVREGKVYKS